MGNYWMRFHLCSGWDNHNGKWYKGLEVSLLVDSIETVTAIDKELCRIRTTSGDNLEVLRSYEDVMRVVYKAGGKEIE